MAKVVKLSDKTALTLNKAAAKILISRKQTDNLSDDEVINTALNHFVGGSF